MHTPRDTLSSSSSSSSSSDSSFLVSPKTSITTNTKINPSENIPPNGDGKLSSIDKLMKMYRAASSRRLLRNPNSITSINNEDCIDHKTIKKVSIVKRPWMQLKRSQSMQAMDESLLLEENCGAEEAEVKTKELGFAAKIAAAMAIAACDEDEDEIRKSSVFTSVINSSRNVNGGFKEVPLSYAKQGVNQYGGRLMTVEPAMVKTTPPLRKSRRARLKRFTKLRRTRVFFACVMKRLKKVFSPPSKTRIKMINK